MTTRTYALAALVELLSTHQFSARFHRVLYWHDVTEADTNQIAIADTSCVYSRDNAELRGDLAVEIYFVVFADSSTNAAWLAGQIEEEIIALLVGTNPLSNLVSSIEIVDSDKLVPSKDRAAAVAINIILGLRYDNSAL